MAGDASFVAVIQETQTICVVSLIKGDGRDCASTRLVSRSKWGTRPTVFRRH